MGVTVDDALTVTIDGVKAVLARDGGVRLLVPVHGKDSRQEFVRLLLEEHVVLSESEQFLYLQGPMSEKGRSALREVITDAGVMVTVLEPHVSFWGSRPERTDHFRHLVTGVLEVSGIFTGLPLDPPADLS